MIGLLVAALSSVFLASPAFAKEKSAGGTPPGFHKGEKKGGEGGAPPGWTQGKKKGWKGAGTTPGGKKKLGKTKKL